MMTSQTSELQMPETGGPEVNARTQRVDDGVLPSVLGETLESWLYYQRVFSIALDLVSDKRPLNGRPNLQQPIDVRHLTEEELWHWVRDIDEWQQATAELTPASLEALEKTERELSAISTKRAIKAFRNRAFRLAPTREAFFAMQTTVHRIATDLSLKFVSPDGAADELLAFVEHYLSASLSDEGMDGVPQSGNSG